MVVGYRRIRSEKLREHQYREGYPRPLGGKRVEWDGDDNVEHIWGLSESGGKEPKECVVER